ncbi:MAG: hypothetical protein ABIR56_09110 [Polaromonas sp.]
MKSTFLGAREEGFPDSPINNAGEPVQTRAPARFLSVNLDGLREKFLHALGLVSHAANDVPTDKLTTG